MSHNKIDLHPLGLTVHNPPSMQALSDHTHRSSVQRAGRWKMLLVMAVCAAPVLASYFTYYVVRPEGRRNFGQLMEPQQPMPAHLRVQTLSGESLPLEHLKGQWLLVSTSGAACDTQCEGHLYLQRQLRESLGREKDRLDWVWLINDGALPAAALQPALATAKVLHMPAPEVAQWLQAAPGQQLSDHLYVVDPQGHWMLRFPAHMAAEDAAKAKRDLDRLLRASSSWDKAGR